jgi:hypothetical protein
MTTRCTIAPEMLAALVRGELPTDAARELEMHATRCDECTSELTWLRAERRLLSERASAAPAPPPSVWQAIERRTGLARARRRRIGLITGASTLALVAAAALTLTLCRPARPAGPSGPGPSVAGTGAGDDGGSIPGGIRTPEPTPLPAPTRSSDQAMARAEEELDEAIGTLQAEYAKKRPTMAPERAKRVDDNLAAARAAVDEARRHAGSDPTARRRLLRARFRYMHSMQEVVLAPAAANRTGPSAPTPMPKPKDGEL